MKGNFIRFFVLQRQIFGVCKCCNEIFRLSDVKIFLKTKPSNDWLDNLNKTTERLDKLEEKIEDEKEKIQERARISGRLKARKLINKIDLLFSPRKLNSDDSKVLFHPIDYVVFDGMKSGSIKRLLLLDREAITKDERRLQNSIEKTISSGNYEWITIRANNDGTIAEE